MILATRSGLASIVLVVVSAAVPVTAAQTSNTTCIALVQSGNNLWRAQFNGTPINQVTNDTLPRYAAALNPTGNLIAFSGKQKPDDITVLDATGRTVLNMSVNAEDAIINLKWLSPFILRAEEHFSPNNSKFHFIDFSSGYSAPIVAPGAAVGTQCAPSPDGKDMACQLAASDLTLNGRTVYRVVDEFSQAASLQSLSIAAGTSVLTSTSPPFRIDFKGVTRTGRMNLRVTGPDGLWSEQSVAPAGRLVVRFADDSHPMGDYGFEPAISSPGVIRLDVKKSQRGEDRFEGEVAWDPRGKRLAVVTANQLAGDRTLIVLNRQTGHAADTGNGGIDLQQRLPLAGPIRSIAFTSETHLRVSGATQQFDLDIPAQGKITNGGAFSVSDALPSTLNLNFATGTTPAEVKDWVCR